MSTVTMNRDDAYWLINLAQHLTLVEGQADRYRLTSLSDALDAQPIREGRPVGDPDGLDVFVVRVEFSEQAPLAVRTNLGEALELARMFNLASPAFPAEVIGYRFDGVGYGKGMPVTN